MVVTHYDFVNEEMIDEASAPGGRGVKVIVREALEAYGGPFRVPTSYTGPKPVVLCLLLDAHWYLTCIMSLIIGVN
jgi:hypothetical protein